MSVLPCPCRLESLRRLVPHAERANTATFLEEVIKYIQVMQAKNANLERMIRELQQAPLPGQGPAGMQAAAAAAAAAAAGADAAAGQLLLRQQVSSGVSLQGLSLPMAIDNLSQQLPVHAHQQHMLRAGSSGSLGPMAAAQQGAAVQQGFGACAHPGGPLGSSSPAVMMLQQQQQQQNAAAQSGAAALLAAAGATAAMAAANSTGAGAGFNTDPAINSSAAAAAAGGGSVGPASTAAAHDSPAGQPSATVQVPDVLQSLLPQGLDLQQMLQQALLSTQAQLLAQLQQHQQQQTSSGTGATAGTAGAVNAEAAAGTAATSSGGNSSQPATSTAALSAMQQALSGQRQGSSTQQQQQQLAGTTGAMLHPPTARLLGSPPSLVMPQASRAAAAQQQHQQHQHMLQPAPALEFTQQQLQQQQQGQLGGFPDGNPAVSDGLQTAGLLAINQIMAQLRANTPHASLAPASTASMLPAGQPAGGHAAAQGSDAKQMGPSGAAALPGGSPARRAAAAAVTADAAFSGGDGNGSSGGMPSLPNLLAMVAPGGVLEQRSSSMSGERDEEGAVPRKKRKMLVL